MLRLLGVLGSGLLVAGCELSVAADLRVEADGSGVAALHLVVDEELVAELDALRVDPFAEASSVARGDPAWELRRERLEGGGEQVVLERAAATPDELTAVLRDVSAGLAEEDPALLVDLHLDVDEEGAAALSGEAGLRLPATPGVSGEDVEVTGDDLAALAADAVGAQLRVRLPGPVVSHDADRTEDGVLVWDLPHDAVRDVRADSDPPLMIPWLWVAVGAGGLLAVCLLVWGLVRR